MGKVTVVLWVVGHSRWLNRIPIYRLRPLKKNILEVDIYKHWLCYCDIVTLTVCVMTYALVVCIMTYCD